MSHFVSVVVKYAWGSVLLEPLVPQDLFGPIMGIVLGEVDSMCPELGAPVDILDASGYSPGALFAAGGVSMKDLALVVYQKDICFKNHTFDALFSIGKSLKSFGFEASGIIDGKIPLLPYITALGVMNSIDFELPILMACLGCTAPPGNYCPPGLLALRTRPYQLCESPLTQLPYRIQVHYRAQQARFVKGAQLWIKQHNVCEGHILK